MERVSKPFYLGSIYGGVFLAFILAVTAGDAPYSVSREAAKGLIAMAIPLVIFSMVIFLMLIHKAWSAIQNGHAGTTPGKAVGFLFIPYFNFYWIFRMWYGFAKDFNKYIARHSVQVARMPQKLFLAVPIFAIAPLVLVAVIQILRLPRSTSDVVGGFLTLGSLLTELVLTFIALYKMCSAINSLAQHRAGTEPTGL